jgi:hypothetical protein
MGKHLTEPAWRSLIKRLRTESPEFEVLWVWHEVQTMRDLTKRFRHYELGVLTFDYTCLWLDQRSELRMTTYRPADEHTASLLRRL